MKHGSIKNILEEKNSSFDPNHTTNVKKNTFFRCGACFTLIYTMLLAPLSGVTVHDAPTQEERDAIKAAAGAIANELPGLGYAVGTLPDGSNWHGGSIVKLSDTIAISAAHGSDQEPGVEYETIRIGFGNLLDGLNGEETTYTVTSFTRHETHDLVIYDLSGDPMTGHPNAKLHDGAVGIGDLVHFGGYGVFSHAGGATTLEGDKCGFRGYIQDHDDPFHPNHYLYSEFVRSTTKPGYHEEAGLADDGDSGGGVFVQMPDNSYELVGITEVVTGSNNYSRHTGFLPLSLPDVQSFLEPFVGSTVVVENPEMDDDNDSQNNLTEYALGSDPQDASSRPELMQTFRFDSGTRMMVLCYLRRTDGSVIYEGEASHDLETWFPATPCDPPGEGLTSAPEGYEWAAVCVREDGAAGFARIRVSLREP